MRPFERRANQAYPYFKMARWDDRNGTWIGGKRAYETEAAARADAKQPGRYRLCRIDQTGYENLEPFTKD